MKCFFVLFLISSIGFAQEVKKDCITKIVVVNNTDYHLKDVMIFSQKITDLQAGKSSKEISFVFENLVHNATLMCAYKDLNLGYFLPEPEKAKSYVCGINDFSVKNKIMKVSFEEVLD